MTDEKYENPSVAQWRKWLVNDHMPKGGEYGIAVPVRRILDQPWDLGRTPDGEIVRVWDEDQFGDFLRSGDLGEPIDPMSLVYALRAAHEWDLAAEVLALVNRGRAARGTGVRHGR